VSDIIKTWPAQVEPRIAAQIFSREGAFARYYFTLGRGRPKQKIERMWFTYRARIVGSFFVEAVVCNDGSLPQLKRLSEPDSDSAWQIRKDAWVAVCVPGCERPLERVFMSGFRGWRYFDYESYKGTLEAKCRLI
jgi:hypothetical protein